MRINTTTPATSTTGQQHPRLVAEHLDGVRAAAAVAGLSFPVSRAQLVYLMSDCLQYMINLDTCDRLADCGILPLAGPYDAECVARLTVGLELRRLWKPRSTLHDGKKSQLRLRSESRDEWHAAEFEARMANFTSLELCNMLFECDSKDEVESLAEILLMRCDPLDRCFREVVESEHDE